MIMAGEPHTDVAANTPFLNKTCCWASRFVISRRRPLNTVCTQGQVSLSSHQVLCPCITKWWQGRKCTSEGLAGTLKHMEGFQVIAFTKYALCPFSLPYQDKQTMLVVGSTRAVQEELCCTRASADPTYPCYIWEDQNDRLRALGTRL